jgi:hypothetical protein
MMTSFLSALSLFILPILFGILLMGKKPLRDVVILTVTAVAGYILWRLYSPYPYPLNWDIWEHQTIINAILSGKYALLPSTLSDTFRFNGYTTLFHLWLSVPQSLFKPEILGFWWFSEFFLCLTAGIAAYAFSMTLTKNRWVGITAGVMSTFFFEPALSYTSYFLMPQTITAILWVFGLTFLIQHKNRPSHLFVMIPLSVLLISLHFIIGGAGVVLYLFYSILEKSHMLDKNFFYFLSVAGLPVFVFGLLSFVTRAFPVHMINFGEAGSFSKTIPQLITDMRGWYGLLPLFLVPFGIIEVKTGQYRTAGRISTLLFFILGAMIISPFPYMTKFIVLWRFLLILFMAIGMGYFLNKVTGMLAKGMILFLFIVTCETIFLVNIQTWQKTVTYRGKASQLSDDEQKTAQFLSTQRVGNTFFVSDPATSYILEALSGVNSPGGAYMDRDNRVSLSSALLSDSPDECTQSLNKIRDRLYPNHTLTYVVISARTLSWLDSGDTMRVSNAWNVWTPRELSLRDRIQLQHIEETCELTPVYQTGSIVVFKKSL